MADNVLGVKRRPAGVSRRRKLRTKCASLNSAGKAPQCGAAAFHAMLSAGPRAWGNLLPHARARRRTRRTRPPRRPTDAARERYEARGVRPELPEQGPATQTQGTARAAAVLAGGARSYDAGPSAMAVAGDDELSPPHSPAGRKSARWGSPIICVGRPGPGR